VTDTFISGGGIFDDQELPDGSRIRFRPTGNPSEDIDVWVEDGRVHLAGHYTRLAAAFRGNHVVVVPIKLPRVR
jgi:hypothetical protein